jgi:hypothetical protein
VLRDLKVFREFLVIRAQLDPLVLKVLLDLLAFKAFKVSMDFKVLWALKVMLVLALISKALSQLLEICHLRVLRVMATLSKLIATSIFTLPLKLG